MNINEGFIWSNPINRARLPIAHNTGYKNKVHCQRWTNIFGITFSGVPIDHQNLHSTVSVLVYPLEFDGKTKLLKMWDSFYIKYSNTNENRREETTPVVFSQRSFSRALIISLVCILILDPKTSKWGRLAYIVLQKHKGQRAGH